MNYFKIVLSLMLFFYSSIIMGQSCIPLDESNTDDIGCVLSGIPSEDPEFYTH